MPRGVKKENLPSKVCVTCGRPFTWRKKWERVWDEVTTCSKSCNRKRRLVNRQTNNNNNNDNGRNLIIEIGGQSSTGIDTEPIIQTELSLDTTSSSTLQNSFVDNELSIEMLEKLEVSLNEESSRPTPTTNDVEDDEDSTNSVVVSEEDPKTIAKRQRKAAKKAKKAERRAQREGKGDKSAGQKQCDMCGKSVYLLIRCMYEEGQVDWKMVCGKCWNTASGGVVDGDSSHPHYRYGGLWKNRRAQT